MNEFINADLLNDEAKNARLIAAAPEMYELLQEVAHSCCDNCVPIMDWAREITARIDGYDAYED